MEDLSEICTKVETELFVTQKERVDKLPSTRGTKMGRKAGVQDYTDPAVVGKFKKPEEQFKLVKEGMKVDGKTKKQKKQRRREIWFSSPLSQFALVVIEL